MSEESQVVGRRGLIRSGAIAATVTAGAVIAGASAQQARAANGDAVQVGGSHTGTSTTTLSVTSATVAPLTLTNSAGPSLALGAFEGQPPPLAVGQIVNTSDGPFIGVDEDDPVNTFLATAFDLAATFQSYPIGPLRILDTRTVAGRRLILRTSSRAFDASYRLKSGAWLDLIVGDTNLDYRANAVMLNLTATGALGSGYVTAYPTDPRPNASTVNFTRNQTIANAAFVGVAEVGARYTVRLYAAATTHLIADLTGMTLNDLPGPTASRSAAAEQRKANHRVRPAVRRPRLLSGPRRR